MFFAVSTGRSGSTTLAQVLTQSPSCLCLHEPHPQLVAESARYCYGELATGAAASLIRSTRVPRVGGRVYGETNNRLSLMVVPVRRAFPEAQFVWLLRDGRDFVASELQRGAYGPALGSWWAHSKWDRWRLDGARASAVDSDVWASWDPFTKLCWQWSWVNRRIERDLDGLGPSGARVVLVEEIASHLDELVAWLGIDPVDFVIPRANRRGTVSDLGGTGGAGPNLVPTVASWRSWTAPMRKIFENHAALLMDEKYPGWRADDGTWQVRAARPSRGPIGASDHNDGDVRNLTLGNSARAALADERARSAALLVTLEEERSEYDELVSSPRLLLRRLAITIGRSVRGRPIPRRALGGRPVNDRR